MNFTQALKHMLTGGTVSLNGVTYTMDAGDLGLVFAESGEAVALTTALLDAITYSIVNVIPALGADEIFVVFKEDIARWVSTTEVAKHKAAGRRVAIFHLDQLI